MGRAVPWMREKVGAVLKRTKMRVAMRVIFMIRSTVEKEKAGSRTHAGFLAVRAEEP